MLDALRRGSTGIVAKLLLSLLILSFGIWGIADVFTGYSRGRGGDRWRRKDLCHGLYRVLRSELDGISAEAERRVTMEDARRQASTARALQDDWANGA